MGARDNEIGETRAVFALQTLLDFRYLLFGIATDTRENFAGLVALAMENEITRRLGD
jgi:hypothetical protein